MAEPYLTRLRQLVGILSNLHHPAPVIECKHFFSGAALYANGKICATLSPAGLALKLPEAQRKKLTHERKAGPFRFFPNGPVKNGYSLLAGSILDDQKELAEVLSACLYFVAGTTGSDQ